MSASRTSLSLLRNLVPYKTQTRAVTYMPRPGDGSPRPVTLIPGDGIGPLVTNAVEQVMEAMHAPVYFEKYQVHGDMKQIPQEVIDSIRKNKVCLKGGLRTPKGGEVSSLNLHLRRELDLYASLVDCCNLPGLPTRHENVDIVVIRENTEGEYKGLEHEVVPGVVESLKVITKFCSERIAKYAFEYAYLNNRKKVTAVHKANIMKLADGLFLESCREVAARYPTINFPDHTSIGVFLSNADDGKRLTRWPAYVTASAQNYLPNPALDNIHRTFSSNVRFIRSANPFCCEQFDVMITPNLYGNLVANTAAGIAGGTGVMPGGNVGAEHAVFEQGASAGNVGKKKMVEQKTANPLALLLSSAMMLRHLQFPAFANRLEEAVKNVILEGKYRTKDLGGDSTTQQVVDAVIAKIG
ncbi:hypothetical protein V6Z11_A12G036700 [Gossypium hirsutum]